MRRSGIDADQQIQLLNGRCRIGKIVQTGGQVNQRQTGWPTQQRLLSQAFLQAVKLHPSHLPQVGQRFQPRQRAFSIVFKLCPTLPDQANA